MSIGIAYNPCKNCKETDKCSICELTYYRKGYINSPTADVVEVVRCRDCKWWKRMNGDKRLQCFHSHGLIRTTENDYCSRGERREENEG